MNRTTVVNFELADIRTWDLEKIVEQTVKEHQLALKEDDALKKEKIDAGLF